MRERTLITDVVERPIAEMSIVPTVFVTRAMATLRKAPTLPLKERLEVIERAGEAFRSGTVEGLTAVEYHHLVSRSCGVPISVIRASTDYVAQHMGQIDTAVRCAQPRAAVTDWRDPATRHGSAMWVRKGSVFAVGSAGNYPGIHTGWLEAFALGYRIAVRPSRQEPFTPQRLVGALRGAGLDPDQIVMLPSTYQSADEMIRSSDLATVYGGDDVMRRYAHEPKVFRQGPGRTKVLITADVDWREHIDAIVDSVSGGAGVGCVNATAVLVEDDPGPLAEALAERLSLLPSLPPEDDKAALPVQPLVKARRLQEYLHAVADGTTPVLGSAQVVDALGDGSAVMRPAVHILSTPTAKQASVELPFPCVWVARWSPEAGLAPLRDSLVVSVLTQDERLLDALVSEPTIGNVYVGDTPSHWSRLGMPHDGYLAEFLMRTKGVIQPCP